MAHVRQSRPESGLGFQVKVLTTFEVVPSPLGRGVPVFESAPLLPGVARLPRPHTKKGTRPSAQDACEGRTPSITHTSRTRSSVKHTCEERDPVQNTRASEAECLCSKDRVPRLPEGGHQITRSGQYVHYVWWSTRFDPLCHRDVLVDRPRGVRRGTSLIGRRSRHAHCR